MADEVIIIEARAATVGNNGNPTSVLGDILTTQVLDIATASAQLNANTEVVRIQSKGVGFWFKTGLTAGAAAAAADTDGNVWLYADDYMDIQVNQKHMKFIDTAADA